MGYLNGAIVCGNQKILVESLRGPQGFEGPKGIKGDKGDSGTGCKIQSGAIVCGDFQIALETLRGPKGDKGDTGAAGPPGSKGDTGAKGETGLQGPKGETGSKGETGLQGPKVDQGIAGPPGFADCNTTVKPTILTGGACFAGSLKPLRINMPTINPSTNRPLFNRWQCRGDSTSNTEGKLTAYAVCCGQ